MIAKNVVLGILLPFLVALGESALPPGRRNEGALARGWRYTSAVGIGYAAGHLGLLGFPSPPREAVEWIFYVALMGTVLSFLEPLWHQRRALIRLTRWLFALGAAWLILFPLTRYAWSPGESALRVLVVSALLLAMRWLLGSLDKHSPPFLYSLLVIGICVAEAFTLILSHTALLAQMCGVLASTLGGILVTASIYRRASPSLSGAGAVAATALVLLGISGFFYADTPWHSLLLLGLSPLPALFAWPLRTHAAWAAGLGGSLALAASSALATALAGLG